MKVMIVANGYPTKQRRMAGIFEFDQAKALKSAGCEVIYAVVNLRSIRHRRKMGFEHLFKDGIEIYSISIPCGPLPLPLLNIVGIFGLRKLYSRILNDKGKLDIIHAHFYQYGYMASKLKEITNAKLVVTEHYSGLMKDNYSYWLYNTALKAYEDADSLIAVSPALVNRIENKFNKKPVYIPNIIDIDTFRNCRSDKRINKNSFTFISVGNLIPRKRMDLTIEAFYKAFYDKNSNKEVDYQLLICGEGSEKKKCENLIIKYDIADKVTMMGMCTRKEISLLMSKSDCFVLASQAETFGVVYVEAMVSGLPVIATRCGGPEEFVSEDNGLLIPIDDVDSLKQAMLNISSEIDKYDRNRISEKSTIKFSPESVSEKILKVYEQLYK